RPLCPSEGRPWRLLVTPARMPKRREPRSWHAACWLWNDSRFAWLSLPGTIESFAVTAPTRTVVDLVDADVAKDAASCSRPLSLDLPQGARENCHHSSAVPGGSARRRRSHLPGR